jgi:hypothetical protein
LPKFSFVGVSVDDTPREGALPLASPSPLRRNDFTVASGMRPRAGAHQMRRNP